MCQGYTLKVMSLQLSCSIAGSKLNVNSNIVRLRAWEGIITSPLRITGVETRVYKVYGIRPFWFSMGTESTPIWFSTYDIWEGWARTKLPSTKKSLGDSHLILSCKPSVAIGMVGDHMTLKLADVNGRLFQIICHVTSKEKIPQT